MSPRMQKMAQIVHIWCGITFIIQRVRDHGAMNGPANFENNPLKLRTWAACSAAHPNVERPNALLADDNTAQLLRAAW